MANTQNFDHHRAAVEESARSAVVRPFPNQPSTGLRPFSSDGVVVPLRHRSLAIVGPYRRFGKRIFDVAVASAILAAASPVFAVAWVILRVALGKGVIIAQDRVGLHGEVFGMYKFRTMRWSRRQRQEDGFSGPDRRLVHKSDNDPRHTPVGRVFRKLSVDELPQLLNVLKGDMSLVGPRPEMVQVVDSIGERHHRRHSIRPGMTGEWQVTVRQSGAPLHECFDHDLPYLDRITLRNDLSILARTVGVVIGQGGR